jgi:DNA-binding transcriptional LysR family regulator
MRLPFDRDLLRTFLAVAESGNFTRAGDKVGRTQSAVSTQIKRLEDSLGEMLFERGARGVELTGRGRQLVPYARRIVGLVEEAAAALRSAPLDGPVRIGIPEEYSRTILPRVLAAFAERHPAVEVSVRCARSEPLLRALENDELDLAVIYDWNRESMNGEVLCIDPTVWVTSDVHAMHEQRPLPVAICMDGTWCREFAIRSLEQHGLDYRIAYAADSNSALRGAVDSGFALAPLSRSNIPPGCRELTAADGFPWIDSSRVVLRHNPLRSSAAVDGMAEMIRQAFTPSPTVPA